jgi:hypothetical protein
VTVLHKDAQPISAKGTMPESHCCIDCGYNTHPGCPPRELADFLLSRDGKCPMTFSAESEVYMAKDEIWRLAGMQPMGGCLCIACLEKRIGRKLRPKDFGDHVFNDPGLPCTDRLRDRRGG